MDLTLQRKTGKGNQEQELAALSDEELLLRYREKNDRKSFEELVHRYEQELYNYLRRYMGDSTLAEDTFQNTFLQLHLKCEQFEKGARLRPWLYTIATHQAIDALRKNRRHKMVSLDRPNYSKEEDLGALLQLLSGEEAGPSENLQTSERAAWVRQTIGELPDHLRSTVLLAYYQSLKYREIAEVLEVPVGTVKSRLHTAVKKIHESWLKSGLA